MTKPLNFNSQLVGQYLKAKDYSSLSVYLKNVFKLERTHTGAPLQFTFSKDAVTVLLATLKQLLNEVISEEHNNILQELFRSLRNYVTNAEVQNFLITNDDFLQDVKNVIVFAKKYTNTLQMILQFLNNLIISNPAGAQKAHDVFMFEVINCLKEKTNLYETAAILYNISLHKELVFEFEVYSHILDIYELDDIEFVHFLLERFITQDQFWDNYLAFGIKHRTAVQGLIRDKQLKGESLNLPEHALKTLTTQFVKSGNIIFQTASRTASNLEPYEVSLLLEVISSLCSTEEYLKVLQNYKDLLINSGVLLINIHRLGKVDENCFTSIQSLAEIRDPNKTINEHPAFGFKADLVRIIGNLSWKNKIMQDLTREAELIPVILDCCNMDARNPFIMQWVILAVRNLCENNLENQQVIASLHQQGTVSTSVLTEMGLTLHSDDNNSLKIIPLDALRNRK